MTKKELRKIMLKVIKNCRDDNHDSWYCTDKEIAEVGIGWLAEELNINLSEGEDQ